MTTERERRALLAYAREWGRSGMFTPLGREGLALVDDGQSGSSYVTVHQHDYWMFRNIAESLAYDGTDGP